MDIRYAFRTMWKTPGFTAAAILALTLGIGANTAIFTVINAVLLRPLPYRDAGRLVQLTRKFPQGRPFTISLPRFFAWKRATADVLADVAVYDFMGPGVSLSGEGQPEQIKAIHVSQDYFSLFGVQPVAGRFFTGEEDHPGGPRVAVLSHALWIRRFGGDQGVVGRPVLLSGEQYVVVGIAAAGYEPNPPAEIWLPLQADPNSTNHGNYLLCGARLKPGVTLGRADAAMKAAAEQFRRVYPDEISKEETAEAVPLRDFLVGEIRPLLLITFGAVGCVLLIACTNVANLLLARGATREKELALRTAVGAGRARLIRQLLTESGLLAAAGGAFGILLGWWGLNLLLVFAPSELPRLSELAARQGLDWTVLGFTLGLSIFTGVLFGLAPALHISRPDVSTLLREGSGRTSAAKGHMRARALLIVTEIALGVVLLAGAALLIRTVMSMRSVAPGFDTAHVLTFRTALSGSRYGKTAGAALFSRQVVERLESLPGIQAAATAVSLPTMIGPDMPFEIEGRKEKSGGDEFWRFVSPHFFKALQVPLLRGRVFAETDVQGAPAVVIINDALARKYWPKDDPIGQRITIGKGIAAEMADPTREIVGVVGSVHEAGLDQDSPPVMYVPQAQVSDGLTALINQALPVAWVLSTAGESMAAAATVRREIAAVDPQQAVFEFRSMGQVLGQSMATRNFLLVLLTVFAAVALLLAAIGIYGVMSYSVEQRTNEIGVRMALGAGRPQVLWMVMRQGTLLIVTGVVVGLAGAYATTRVLSTLLFGVKAADPTTFAGVAVVLSAVALVAILVPAYRATHVNPVEALRWQ